MKVFQRPTTVNEFSNQEIKQLGMCGKRSHLAEIRWRIDESLAEMMLPDTINDHPCGERMIGTGQVFGQG